MFFKKWREGEVELEVRKKAYRKVGIEQRGGRHTGMHVAQAKPAGMARHHSCHIQGSVEWKMEEGVEGNSQNLVLLPEPPRLYATLKCHGTHTGKQTKMSGPTQRTVLCA